MSGTSLDGLDIALCEIRGRGTGTEVELKEFETIPYDRTAKQRLKAITSVEQVSLEEVCMLHSWLGSFHGELVTDVLQKWNRSPSQIDCIASHGQTIYHAPRRQHGKADMPDATLQIGDGDHLAQSSGILTISDFRQKHTACGGEGAPMVSLADRMLYRNKNEDRILLNIGGIANFTYLPAENNRDRPSITTDTGPGNTLIDQAVQHYFSRDFDRDGKIARRGTVDEKALEMLKSHSYFRQSLPKTTGPEQFNLQWVQQQLSKTGTEKLPAEDLVATLTRLTAETIAEAIQPLIPEKRSAAIYVSGGGLHNPVLMEWIEELLSRCTLKNFRAIGFNPDAKEAVLFAVLANEMLCGEGFKMSPESAKPTNFGKISFPG